MIDASDDVSAASEGQSPRPQRTRPCTTETAHVTRAGLQKLQLVCEIRHLGRGHYPPFDGQFHRSQRLRVFPIRSIDLRRAGIGGLNTSAPHVQQIPRKSS